MYWVLDGTEVRPSSFEEWIQRPHIRIARDERDDVIVSTIFVGLDIYGAQTPMLFESLVFGGEHNGRRQIYGSWIEAAEGHARLVKDVFR